VKFPVDFVQGARLGSTLLGTAFIFELYFISGCEVEFSWVGLAILAGMLGWFCLLE
jgi:hypothetical protein